MKKFLNIVCLLLKQHRKKLIVMRNTVLILLISVLQVFATGSYAQTKKISLAMNDATIREVLYAIQKQSEFYFLYNSELIDVAKKVDITIEEEKVDEILTRLFDNNEVDFLIKDRYIILTPVGGNAELFAEQQQRGVSGTVTDESGQPLPGVTIVIKGTTQGTVTNADGNYSLANIPENATLVFSFVGMRTQEVEIGNQTVVNITMVMDVIGIEEVVAVGYGTMRKSDLTGAVSKVSSEVLVKLPVSSVSQALQGKVSGVRVLNSQEPGGGSSIRIRGIGTINNSDPLYVIDGFSTGGMNHLTSNEIESIEILKDASATAIYGSRGANGVILITTKSGNFERKPTVHVNAYVGYEKETGRYDMADATEYAILFNEALENNEQILTGPLANQMEYIIANNYKGTDWQDEFIRPGFNQNYNISLSGGTKHSAYDIGATYAHETGIVKKGFSEKIFLHANNDYKITDKIQVGTKLNFHSSLASYGNPFDGLSKEPMVPAWDSYTGNYGVEAVWDNPNPATGLDHRAKYFLDSPFRQFRAKAYLQIDDLVVKGLMFRSQYGISTGYGHSKNYSPVYRVGGYYNDESSLSENRSENRSWVWSNYLIYKADINKHKLNLTLGYEAQEWESDHIAVRVFDVPDAENMYFLNAYNNKETETVSANPLNGSLLSYFTRANYNFDNRFLLTATMRADGSSKFTGDYKWGYFPSFSAGYNIMEESFMEDIKSVFSAFKIRGGWGQVGNQSSAGPYDYAGLVYSGYLTTLGVGQNIVDGAVQLNVANAGLRWEASEQANIGFNFVTANNRLTGSLDLFKRNTKDMIISKPIPMYVGQKRPSINAASMINKGIELELGYNGSTSSGLKYGISVNASYIKNTVCDVPEAILTDRTRTENGFPMAYFWGYQTDGIIKTQEELDAYLDEVSGRAAGLGDVRFIDQLTVDTDDDGMPDAKDGQIGGDDRVMLGNPWPSLVGGLSIDLEYKGFDFSIFGNGEFDKEIWNAQAQTFMKSRMNGSNIFASRMDRWTPENPDSDQPRVHVGDPNKNGEADDRYIEDGSYFRLTSAQLGYTLPTSTMGKIGISSIRLYLICDNILTLTNYSGLNPEVGGGALDSGIDWGTYPLLRTFTVGANIKF